MTRTKKPVEKILVLGPGGNVTTAAVGPSGQVMMYVSGGNDKPIPRRTTWAGNDIQFALTSLRNSMIYTGSK